MSIRVTNLILFMLFLGACSRGAVSPGGPDRPDHFGFTGPASQNPAIKFSVQEAAQKLIPVESLRIEGSELQYLDPRDSVQTWLKFSKVETVPAGKFLHHWGSKSDIDWWVQNGISNDAIRDSIAQTDSRDSNGGGFYVSLSPSDSAPYGTHLLVAELPISISIARFINGFWYSSEQAGYVSSDAQLLLKTTTIADAGIDGIRYYIDWINLLNSRALSRLSEGTWKMFSRESGEQGFSYRNFFTFDTKYPLSDSDISSSEFHFAFPFIARFLDGQPLLEADIDQESSKLVEQVVTADESPLSFMRVGALQERWRRYFEVLALPATKKLAASLQLAIDLHDDGTIRQRIVPFAQFLGSSLSSLNQRFHSVVEPVSILAQAGKLRSEAYSSLHSEFIRNSSLVGFYKMLSRLIRGNKAPWLEAGEETGRMPRSLSPMEQLQLYVQDFPSDDNGHIREIKGILKFYRLGESDYRDFSAIATARSGERKFEISEDGKESIQNNPYLSATFSQELSSLDGKTREFVKYELPSAGNYRKFADELKNPELLKALKDADDSGRLKNTESAEFKALTQKIIAQIIVNIESSARTRQDAFVKLMRIEIFKTDDLNRQFLKALISLDFELGIFDYAWHFTIGQLEYAEFVAMSDRLNNLYFDVVSADPEKTDDPLNRLGLWEIAAARTGYHRDPQLFIQEVRQRLLQSDVQSWIESGDEEKVRSALHDASVN